MMTYAINNSKDAVMLLTGIDMEEIPLAKSVSSCSYTRNGVICGAFFSNPQYIGEMVTITIGMICATFVLYLCFTRAALNDVINLFTMNIFGPMLILLFFQALDLIQLYFADYGIISRPLMTITTCCLMLFGTVNSVNFRALSILLLLSIYCSYSYPITHAKYFNFRKWNSYFLIFNILALLFGAHNVVISIFASYETAIWSLIPFFIISYMVTIIATAMAVKAAVKYFKNRAHRRDYRSNQARLLISTIVYATPANICNIPGLLIGIMLTMSLIWPLSNASIKIYYFIAVLQLFQAQIKPIIMTLSTLIAFPVYRKAFIRVMTPMQIKHKKLIKVIAIRKWIRHNKIDYLNRI